METQGQYVCCENSLMNAYMRNIGILFVLCSYDFNMRHIRNKNKTRYVCTAHMPLKMANLRVFSLEGQTS